MIVISDTSPICYLLLIEQIHLLPLLYGKMLIPERVQRELADERSPASVRAWIASPPDWLSVQAVVSPTFLELEGLDPGEQEAIQLAQEVGADLLLLDDLAARRVAGTRGLRVTGLVGVLEAAATENLINLPEVVARLQQTSFRISERILQQMLERFSS